MNIVVTAIAAPRWLCSRALCGAGCFIGTLVVSLAVGCSLRRYPCVPSPPLAPCPALGPLAGPQAATPPTFAQALEMSDSSAGAWRVRLSRLASAHVAVGYIQLPIADVDDVPALVSLISEFTLAAAVLAQDERLAIRARPTVLRMFHESVKARLGELEATESRLRTPRSEATANTRLGALRIMRSLGPAASAAIPDLLDLLRRQELDDEYAGPMSTLERSIAAVCWEEPKALLDVARGDEAVQVRRAVVRAIGFMPPAAAPRVAPDLLQLLEEAEPSVATVAATSLVRLEWYRAEFLARARARLVRATAPYDEQLARTVEVLERKLEKGP